MTRPALRSFLTPREEDLGLNRIANETGLSISALPIGCVFTIEHEGENGRIMINQIAGSPVAGGIGRIILRIGGPEGELIEAVGPTAKVRFGVGPDRFVWDGETAGLRHSATLWLHPRSNLWLWRIDVANLRSGDVSIDAVLIQDLGLGDRGFVTNNESYASQYIDHQIPNHPRFGPVVMSRQNLPQGGRHPWIAHGCVEGAVEFATDGLQAFGPEFRDSGQVALAAEVDLPSERLQHELACPMIQSRRMFVEPGATAGWSFFALFAPDHPEASSDADLGRLDEVEAAAQAFAPRETSFETPPRSLVQDAPPLRALPLGDEAVAHLWPEREHEERDENDRLLSFFTPDPPHNRHVVLAGKERAMRRRHGALLRSGAFMLPDENALSVTCWMHGVFAAQLTIGNTSFQKLFSVSRDPYNITRASGLRILADVGDGWRLLAVPSVFEMGLSDCRWIYRHDGGVISVHASVSGEDPAMQWRLAAEGEPCRFLVFGQLVLGDREYEHAGRVEIDEAAGRFTFRPEPDQLWARTHPDAVLHLVACTPDVVEAVGADDLLFADGASRGGGHVAFRTQRTHEVRFAVVGSMEDPKEARRLADAYTRGVAAAAMLAPAARHWERVTRGLRLRGNQPDAAALNTIFPWFAHDAMMHLTSPHGLEQYSGAAWGTRDVCQGPIEFFLALEHDEAAKDILRIVFAQQFEERGDWPQWFMLEPYDQIRDRHSHGDVIVWPLKALCDYLEATNDLEFLDEAAAWRRDDTLEKTERTDSIADHVRKLLAAVQERFIPGTRLIRYGDGDWNDALQPADPALRDTMASSWTVALLYQQTRRYAEILRRTKRSDEAAALDALAGGMREDVNRWLIRDGVLAGYALFDPEAEGPELLLHPSDTRTGLRASLIPMTRSIIAGLFTPEQAERHLRLIRESLLFPDGVRLMDRPAAYRGGPEKLFRRAESAAFFGREIGLMYVHAHLRWCEALAALGEADALWDAMMIVNPIAVTERLSNAGLRQRNAYFSSSDAAFRDRYEASAEWDRVRAGTVPVEGGWRIYSSGPGLYTRALLCFVAGVGRRFGEPVFDPLSAEDLMIERNIDGRRERWIAARR